MSSTPVLDRTREKPTTPSSQGWRGKLLLPLTAMVEAAVLLFAISGCSLIHRHYAPDTLPPEFQARSLKSARSSDVSLVAGQPGKSDLIAAGDLLKISVAAGLDRDAVTEFYAWVDENGMAHLPEIGRIRLAGLTLIQAGKQVGAVCVHRNLYRQPAVTVAMERQRVNHITVTGAVEEPGVQELPPGSSYLSEAIVAAGGFAEDAGTKVTIRRSSEPPRLAGPAHGPPGPSGVRLVSGEQPLPGRQAQLVCLDLSDKNSQLGRREYLPDGSVVTVERLEPKPIEVVGLVRKPGQYDFPLTYDLNVYSAIALAGGRSSKLADEVLVLRTPPGGQEQITIRVSLRAAKKDATANLKLAPGDIVSVEPNPGTVVVDLIKLLRFGVSAPYLW